MSDLDMSDMIQSAEACKEVQLKSGVSESRTALFFKLYNRKYTEFKSHVDTISATVKERQSHMHQMNELIRSLNSLVDVDDNSLDISNRPDLQQKLDDMRKLGAEIPPLLKFKGKARIDLMETLHLQTNIWDKDNSQQIREADVYAKNMDRLYSLMILIEKNEGSVRKAAHNAARGA